MKAISRAAVIFILLLVAFLIGFKFYRQYTIKKQIDKINQCLDSGGCMDPATMICGPYINDPTKMCGLQ